MTTLIIKDNTSQAKKFVAYGRTLPFVKVLNEKPESEYNLYSSLDGAFADVRLMMDGKKGEKSAEEFLEEMRNSK
ncbi:MAG: hypothetical protein FWD56_06385 [Bacteroidales bacterium]|nr:hypothetical protein [Bacteroidales bacterium]